MQTARVKQKLGWLVALVVLALSLAPTAPRSQAAPVQARMDWGQMPLYFIANQGQMDERVAYYVQGSDRALYFTPDGNTVRIRDTPANGRPDLREPRLATRSSTAVRLSSMHRSQPITEGVEGSISIGNFSTRS
ncbi:MAG: hypothetical protein ACUVWZ_03575 [Anaerolineae bacterium]